MKPKFDCCACCGRRFERRAVSGRPPRYCSQPCRTRARLDRQTATRRSQKLPKEIARLEAMLGDKVATHVMSTSPSGTIEFIPIDRRLSEARAQLHAIESARERA